MKGNSWHRVPYRVNPRWNKPRHSSQIDQKKDKKKTLKATRGRATNNTHGNPLSADFSAETASQEA